MNNLPEQPSHSASSELLKLSSEYMERVEKYVENVTKAVNNAQKMHDYFQEKKKELETSTFEKFIRAMKVLMPCLTPLIFIGILFFLPCGTKWDGYGIKFSNSECSQKNGFQKK